MMKSGIKKKIIFALVAVVMSILLTFLLFPFEKNTLSDFDQFAHDVMNIITKYDDAMPSIDINSEEIIEKNGNRSISSQILETKFDTTIDIEGETIVLLSNNQKYVIDKENNVAEVKGERLALAVNDREISAQFIDLDLVADILGYDIEEKDDGVILHKNFATSRLIIKSDKAPDKLDAVMTASGYNDYYIYQFNDYLSCEEAYNYYLTCDYIDFVEEDIVITTQEVSEPVVMGVTDNFSYKTWGADAMGVQEYSEYLLQMGQSNLREVVVAVLDTGLDSDHSWFQNRIYAGGKNYSTSVSDTEYEWEDSHGHGSHVSGTIVDLTLLNVKILPIKVMNDSGKGVASSIVLGMNYVSELKSQGANIYAMNMSLGSQSGINTTDYNSYVTAVDTAYENKILTVVAAGNDGIDVTRVTPANVSKAITVSAVGVNGDSFYRPSWSNYGTYVDIAAPGVEIVSAYPGNKLAYMDGTSMATPHIVGAIALIYSNPNITYSLKDIENMLIANALDLGSAGKDVYFGYGLLNIEYAYASIMENVQFSRTDTNFDTPFELTLSSGESDAIIYYTLDGTNPTTASKKYVSPITIDESVVVKAVAYVMEGDKVIKFSRITSYTYCYNNQDVSDSYQVSEDGVLTKYTGILTELTVPSTINGIEIVAVGESAFASSIVEKVILADTIKTIGVAAFEGVETLKYIVGVGVEIIDMYAFNGCVNLTTLTDIEFPSLQKIGKYAFYHASSLKDVDLSSVEFIDDWAFGMDGVSARSLVNINFPNVKVVENSAFYSCSNLINVSMPKVQYICSQAFYNCDLSVVDFALCQFVGNAAFLYNTNIVKVNLPIAKVIGSYAFGSATAKLTDIDIDNVVTIGAYAFNNCKGISILNTSRLQYIGKYAFANCNMLSYIDMSSVEVVGVAAFSKCVSLTSVQIPNVIEIRRESFVGSAINQVECSPCIRVIDNAFSGETILFKVYHDTIAESYAKDNGYNIEYLDDASGFTYEEIGNYIKLTGHTDITLVFTIPTYINGKPVRVIGEDAFVGSSIEYINLPYVEVIENGAFANSTSLKGVRLGEIIEIGAEAFSGCRELNYVDIDNANKIGDNAFAGTSLLQVKLSKVLEIGERAFGYNSLGQVVDGFVLIGESGGIGEDYALSNGLEFLSIFSNIPYFYYNYYTNNGQEEIYIALVDTDITGNIILPSSYDGYIISKIGDGAFANCSFVTGVQLPSSYTIIGSQAFINCSSLETINLENIESIGTGAFCNCYRLKSVDISGLSIVLADVFSGCESLEYVKASNTIIIGEMAFAYCYNLKQIVCPSVQQIMAYAFYQNYNLEQIDTQNIQILGSYAMGGTVATGQVFSETYKLKEMRLPNVEELGSSLFNNSSIERVVLGKSCEYFYSTPIAKTITIYGYSGSEAESYATSHGNTFVAIDEVSVVSDLDSSLQLVQDIDYSLSIKAVGYDLQYQWFISTSSDKANGAAISDAILDTVKVDTSEVGIYYYYVKVTDWSGESVYSNVCEVSVGDLNDYVTITVIQVDNCKISPSGVVVIKKGSNYTFSISPVVGYYIKSIVIDGVAKSSGSTYTFTNITSNHTISAKTSPNTNTVYTVYHYKESLTNTSIYIDGKYYSLYKTETKTGTTDTMTQASCLPENEYKGFVANTIAQTNIQGDGGSTVKIYYDRQVYSVSATSGDGVLYVAGTGGYKYGEEVILYAKLQNGYKLVSINSKQTLDFVVDLGLGTATFNMPSKNVEFVIVAEIKTFALNVIVGVGGKADMSSTFVEYGTQKTINFTADLGYEINKIYVNNQEVGIANNVTVNVYQDTLVQVIFEKIKFDLNLNIDSSYGNIETNGLVDSKIEYGGNVHINIVPEENYEIDKVYVNDQIIENMQGTELELQDVKTNIEIKVVFKQKENIDNSSNEDKTLKLNKTTIIIIAVIVVIFLALAVWVGKIIGRANDRI